MDDEDVFIGPCVICGYEDQLDSQDKCDEHNKLSEEDARVLARVFDSKKEEE